jgi:hypothetical protein
MWGKRKKRRSQLSRQLALGMLEDAMGRVQEAQEEENEPPVAQYPGAVPPPSGPPDPAGLRPADVPVDNSAGPGPGPEADTDEPEPETPPQQQFPAPRTGENSRHGSFG